MEKVFAAGDMRDAFKSIIDDDCQVVGRADILAGEDHITKQGWIDANVIEA